jgi:acyl-CoA dehydrogenase
VIRPIRKAGRNAVASCETFYEELPVEDWRMVGEEGRGFYHILAGLNAERILLAATAIGIGEVALKKAVEYAGQREVFGKPIGSNQAISHPLADAHARLKAAWQMVLLAAWKCDNGLPCGEEANTAKYLAAEAGYMAADRAMQTLGGLGYATEYHVERYWREARVIRIAPVSQEMTLNYLAQNVLGLPKSY